MYFVITLFLLEILFFVITSLTLSSFGFNKYITAGTKIIFLLIDLYFIVYILNSDKHPRFKLAWILLVAIFQSLGVLMYLIFADKKIPYELSNDYLKTQKLLSQDESVNEKIKDKNILKT